MVPERGFEPLSPKAADFESAVYTIPPLWPNNEIIVDSYLKINNNEFIWNYNCYLHENRMYN